MILQRLRLGFGGAPTLGRLTSRDGAFTCDTLERSVDGPHPAIPAGTFPVHLGRHHPASPTGGYPCPVLEDVPGRTDIQIHIANRAEELLGCIAVGRNVSADGQAIEHSEDTFDALMRYLQGVDTWDLSVYDP